MSTREALDSLLATEPADAGCDAVFEALAAYVDLVVAGEDPEVSHPGVTSHLRGCPPCGVDAAGLLAAARGLDAERWGMPD